MNKILLFTLCVCSNVYAESRVLPPVVDNSIYPGGSGSARPSANAMFEVLGRLEQLQLEVQQLRGVVEEQSQTMDDLRKRQGNIYSDLDLRLQEVTGVKTVSKEINAGDGNFQLAAPSVATTAVMPTTAEPVEEVAGSRQAAEGGSSEAVAEVTSPSPAVSDKERYQSAYEMLRNGHNSKAIFGFKALLAESPAGEYADNSQYWLGEAYKVNRKTEAAKQAFLRVVNDYSDSPKVPDALLKLGYIEFEQNNMAKARDYLTQLTVSHPNTTAAHLAAKKLTQMGSMQF